MRIHLASRFELATGRLGVPFAAEGEDRGVEGAGGAIVGKTLEEFGELVVAAGFEQPGGDDELTELCLLYTSPSPRD